MMNTQTTAADIDQLLRDTERVLATVRQHQQERLVFLIVSLVALIFLMIYVYRRWTWIPRKRQRTHFNEKF